MCYCDVYACFRPKLQRQNHERPFTERDFTPLNEQIDEDTSVVFFEPMITSF